MTFVKDYGNYIISRLNTDNEHYLIRVRQICRIIKLEESGSMSAHDSVKAIASIYDNSLLQKSVF